MIKSYIIIVIAFCALAIFGPMVGEKVTEDRMLRERKQIVEKLQEAQKIERERLEKINTAHAEVIEIYQAELKER